MFRSLGDLLCSDTIVTASPPAAAAAGWAWMSAPLAASSTGVRTTKASKIGVFVIVSSWETSLILVGCACRFFLDVSLAYSVVITVSLIHT